MTTEIKVNVADLNGNIREITEAVNALKDYKRMCIVNRVPFGAGNAKTASEILGQDCMSLANLCFFTSRNSHSYTYCEECIIGGERVYRRKKTVRKRYANLDNPEDIITRDTELYVYWRE